MNGEDQIVSSSGNVFADLGFEPAEAQAMAMRADVMIALETAIKARAFTECSARHDVVSEKKVID